MDQAHLRAETGEILLREGIPRSAEVVLAVLGLVAAAPVLAAAAVVIAMTSRGPVLFRQKRVGRGGQPFTLYKLRTMRVSSGGAEITAADDARVTWFGRLLRRAKIDEFPQLWNVIRGQMSLVGPRPEVPRYVDLNDPRWRRVLQVRPGITDPVTVLLRNEEALLGTIPGDREVFYQRQLQPFKLRRYVEYLERRSWRTDVQVLYKTCLAVAFPRRAARGNTGSD